MTGLPSLSGWRLMDRATIAAAGLRTVLVVIIASWLVSNPLILAAVGAGAFFAPVVYGELLLRPGAGESEEGTSQ